MVISELVSLYSKRLDDKKELYYFMGEIFDKDISYFYAHGDETVDDKKVKKLNSYIERRLKGEPVEYIIGKAYFMSCTFKVSKGILIPRSDTETVAEEAVRILSQMKNNPWVLDMCCGSGCIGISVAKLVDNALVTLCDVSDICIETTEKNIKLNRVDDRCRALKSDLFKSIQGRFDIIISNPPYIPMNEYVRLDHSVLDYEPKEALLGGMEGTEYYTDIADKALNFLSKGGYLLFEVGYDQAEYVEKILQDKGYTQIRHVKDLQGIDRVVCARYYSN
ncbi:MAG: peptide chain release factor N(5)-glutamine methyltransferase [Clostridia bacterium]|jgi:release factor glutamine methyltransferase